MTSYSTFSQKVRCGSWLLVRFPQNTLNNAQPHIENCSPSPELWELSWRYLICSLLNTPILVKVNIFVSGQLLKEISTFLDFRVRSTFRILIHVNISKKSGMLKTKLIVPNVLTLDDIWTVKFKLQVYVNNEVRAKGLIIKNAYLYANTR